MFDLDRFCNIFCLDKSLVNGVVLFFFVKSFVDLFFNFLMLCIELMLLFVIDIVIMVILLGYVVVFIKEVF